MKSYFIRLFNYDSFANKLLLDSVISCSSPHHPLKLMAHLLTAQQVWLSRCQGKQATVADLWPDVGAATLLQLITDNLHAWIAFLNTCSAEDFEQTLVYKTLAGVAYQNKLADILGHVINHGTHHRAQAGQWLKTGGLEKLPVTDYIFYLRN